jgi:hypothetical protein
MIETVRNDPGAFALEERGSGSSPNRIASCGLSATSKKSAAFFAKHQA